MSVQTMYQNSTIDWNKIRALAKQVVQAHAAFPRHIELARSWVRQTSDHSGTTGNRLVTQVTRTFCLTAQGDLAVLDLYDTYVESLVFARRSGQANSVGGRLPMRDRDVEWFDFDHPAQDFSISDNVSYYGDLSVGEFFSREDFFDVPQVSKAGVQQRGDGLISLLKELVSPDSTLFDDMAQYGGQTSVAQVKSIRVSIRKTKKQIAKARRAFAAGFLPWVLWVTRGHSVGGFSKALEL